MDGYDASQYGGACPGGGAMPGAAMGQKRSIGEVTSMESVNKRPRIEGEQAPSRVLHVRGLPQDCTEPELIAVACAFGRVTNILMLKGKNQAFIEMQDETTATALVQYYNSVRATIRGKAIYFQFSNRKEITVSNNVETPNYILLITILNVTFSITIDVLQQVFQGYPTLQKIVIFNKGGNLQALVQFNSVEAATRAKMELDGKDIYQGCCTLKIQYSSLESLNVKFNNDKSRDFTNPSLPTGDARPSGGLIPTMGMGGAYMARSGDPLQQSMPHMYGGMDQGWGGAGGYPMPGVGGFGMGAGGFGQQNAGTVLIVNGLPEEGIDPDIVFTLFGVYGDVLRVKIMFKTKEKALVQFTSHVFAQSALQHLNGVNFRGKTLRVNFSKVENINMPRSEDQEGLNLTKDYTNSPLHRFKMPGSKNFQHITQPSSALHLSSLPEESTEEELRTLFGNFGTVANFRFFENHKHMAVLEMGSVEEAIEALIGMHNYQIGDHHMKVSFSTARKSQN
eukprot:TRINITY_DN365_c0_g1_i1.p1 TRINITY_DN365_c0_g1~~TRINITY_DN365_c0_g1_i1.p1  ORF type:complete len:508 (+),score=192.92 TRINITY_DN365_c0_g1_i1:219-1742(+)